MAEKRIPVIMDDADQEDVAEIIRATRLRGASAAIRFAVQQYAAQLRRATPRTTEGE